MQATALGYGKLPIISVQHPFGARSREQVRRIAEKCADEIAELMIQGAPDCQQMRGRGHPMDRARFDSTSKAQVVQGTNRAPLIETGDDLEAINQIYRERSWSDGFPIIPPTVERVERMLLSTDRARESVVARLAPGFGAATVERIAINAVLAGCGPEYLPLLIGAVEAVATPEFNLQAIQATTNPVAIWIIVNGPIARQLKFNGTFNCLGEGTWANATLGRALRLILRNIGGALPGEMDRATQGQPGRYSFCCAENEADSPWEPLHVERGFKREQSTVTVAGIEGTMNMNTHSKDAPELLRVIAETMIHPPSNEYCDGGQPWLILGPEHAEILNRAGYGKALTKARLWELTKLQARRMAVNDLYRTRASRKDELGDIGPDTMLPIAPRAEDICLLVAGGPGTHSIYAPSFGNTRSATRVIAPRALDSV